MYVIVLSGKRCMISVGICIGKSYTFCIMLYCLNPSSKFTCSVLRQPCVFSVEYVFTCTMCFGNILLSLGIVYTNGKLQWTSQKIKNNIKYKNIYIFLNFVSNHCRCVRVPVCSYMDALVWWCNCSYFCGHALPLVLIIGGWWASVIGNMFNILSE
jgi:hypothetical protein